MARKKKQKPQKDTVIQTHSSMLIRNPRKQTFLASGIYFIIASALTYPLIFRMNSSIYGPYDHITTDLFGTVYVYFWWIKEAIVNLKISPLNNPLIAAPFETRMSFVNLTGFAQLPITAMFGHIFSRNFTILFNLVISGLGMFLLVRHITKSAGAGFISGLVFAFCPNMLVRSYTTFDSTQTQWIPLYTLFVIQFIENRTWKNALLAGMFLVFQIIFSFPYYLVYLPVYTIVLLVTYSAWQIWGEKRGIAGFFSDLVSHDALKAWGKIAVVLSGAVIVFAGFYTVFVGGSSTMGSFTRTTEQLEELSVKPLDYLMPHPRSLLFRDGIKESYWDAKRPRKNPDTYVAYIGFIALALTAFGIVKGKGRVKWFFIAGAVVAFWSTLGPKLFGLPTPSGLIHLVYAPFARRIVIYKVFVQLCVAGLAGIGTALILKRLREDVKVVLFLALAGVLMMIEYSIVPPALSVDLKNNPEIYEKISSLPDESIVFETPARRNNGNQYQGYLYYQTVHGKKLFNPPLGISGIPEHIRPFYRQMEVPLEACEYSNLATLRYLGVTHLTYHSYIGTNTVVFRAFASPTLENRMVEGLQHIYESNRQPGRGYYPSPYDYTFADLYEITAEPCPVALVFDYTSPYQQVPGILQIEDYLTQIGWASAIFDTSRTFYPPLPNSDQIDRVIRKTGQISLINLSDEPVDFSVTFLAASADSNRIIETLWNDGTAVGSFETWPEFRRCRISQLHLAGGESGLITIRTQQPAYEYNLGTAKIPAKAVLKNFRIITE